MENQTVTLTPLEWDAVTNQLALRAQLLRAAAKQTKYRVSERAMILVQAEELEAIYAAIEIQRDSPLASRKVY